jgi:hypothetical protein
MITKHYFSMIFFFNLFFAFTFLSLIRVNDINAQTAPPFFTKAHTCFSLNFLMLQSPYISV